MMMPTVRERAGDGPDLHARADNVELEVKYLRREGLPGLGAACWAT